MDTIIQIDFPEQSDISIKDNHLHKIQNFINLCHIIDWENSYGNPHQDNPYYKIYYDGEITWSRKIGSEFTIEYGLSKPVSLNTIKFPCFNLDKYYQHCGFAVMTYQNAKILRKMIYEIQ